MENQNITNTGIISDITQQPDFSFQQNNDLVYILKENEEFPSFWTRLLVFVSNTAVTVFICGIFLSLFVTHYLYRYEFIESVDTILNEDTLFSHLLNSNVFASTVLIFIVLVLTSLRTVGNVIFGLRVVSLSNDRLPWYFQFKRTLFDIVSLLSFGFLQIFKNENKQSWSDKRLHVVVIRSVKYNKKLGILIVLCILGSIYFSVRNGYIFRYGMFENSFNSGMYTVKVPLAIESENTEYGFKFENSTTTIFTRNAHTMIAWDGAKTIYYVGTFYFPDNYISEDNRESSITTILNLITRGSNAFNLSTSSDTFNGKKALQISYCFNEVCNMGYIFENNNIVYIVHQGCFVGKVCDEKKKKVFFDSFHINK